MARSSAALRKLQDAAASQRKRASDLRKKIKTEQPMVVVTTAFGGYLGAMLDNNNPLKQFEWAQNPELIFGLASVAYGLTTSRKGAVEKSITGIGSGLLAVYAYKFGKG